MNRTIVGFHQDELDDWVAELDCFHSQHVRHRPPFQIRPWILEREARHARLGMPMDCPLCDRAELPLDLVITRVGPLWDEISMPSGLRVTHRIASGTWAQIVLHEGTMRFTAETTQSIDVVLEPGSRQAIPPDVAHRIEPFGHVVFAIAWFRRGNGSTNETAPVASVTTCDEGGDPACWAHMVCFDCGAFLEQESHRASCHREDGQ
jgi:tellurite resistance-related uncharacterized protein